MKRAIFLIAFIWIAIIGLEAQFTYFGSTTGDIISDLTNPQKVGVLDAFARGKSVTYVKHTLYIPPVQSKELYKLFSDVNSTTDALLLKYPGANSYTQLLDSLELAFVGEEINRTWLDAIVTKKVNYCTDPAILAPMNNSEKWQKYLELLRE